MFHFISSINIYRGGNLGCQSGLGRRFATQENQVTLNNFWHTNLKPMTKPSWIYYFGLVLITRVSHKIWMIDKNRSLRIYSWILSAYSDNS